jgi:hypothetical protein
MNNKTKLFARVFIFLLALAITAMPTGNASARLVHCRADPIFYLSNGEKITVILEIDTDEANVRNVNYVLHVPAGVRITRVVFTAGGIGRKESYQAVQDSVESVYTTDTVVTTKGGPNAVIATSSITGGTGASASGFNGDLLSVVLVQTLDALTNNK